jgi:uncharacterized OB-fold protein
MSSLFSQCSVCKKIAAPARVFCHYCGAVPQLPVTENVLSDSSTIVASTTVLRQPGEALLSPKTFHLRATSTGTFYISN